MTSDLAMSRILWVLMLALAVPCGADSSSAIFDRPTLLRFQIEISSSEAESLRREPRKAVPAKVVVDGREFPRVGVHIKGSQGSLRGFDDKPSLTLGFGKFDQDARFHGLKKIHLNNSAQDPTYLCEDLAGECFRRAGVPAARVAWAMVELNGRKLGLFVLKEGFTKDFLRQHFRNGDGNLYDGGLHREVNEPLERDSGDGVGDHSDLQALAAAASDPDMASRWTKLQSLLDVDRFVSFMATEVLAGHIDGYCLMQNNYRIYFEPRMNRAVFLPHGMDRMFYEPTASLTPPMKALVARAVGETPEGALLYRRRIAELAEQVFDPAWMTNRINAAVMLLAPVEPLVAREAGPLRERVLARVGFSRAEAAKLRKASVPTISPK